MLERLHKIIAGVGIASRRKAEQLITAGRVTVNGKVVTVLGSKADLKTDVVRVDGNQLKPAAKHHYFAVNKPKGCISTTNDPEGRQTVMELLDRRVRKGVYPVGRLDYNTEGLLLMTNDGDFANHLLSAKNRITKTYEVKVNGFPTPEQIDRLRRGVRLDERLVVPVSIRVQRIAKNPWYEVEIGEGLNRQIHRMFETIGFLVEKIRRVRIGPLALGDLPPGHVRELRPTEVRMLLSTSERSKRPAKRVRAPGFVRRTAASPGKPVGAAGFARKSGSGTAKRAAAAGFDRKPSSGPPKRDGASGFDRKPASSPTKRAVASPFDRKARPSGAKAPGASSSVRNSSSSPARKRPVKAVKSPPGGRRPPTPRGKPRKAFSRSIPKTTP